MAKKSITLGSVAIGIIAIVAGILVIFYFEYARFILGIFLIIWGVISIVNK